MKYFAVLAFLVAAEAAKTIIKGPSALELQSELEQAGAMLSLKQASAADPKAYKAPKLDAPEAVDAPDLELEKGIEKVQKAPVFDAPGAKLSASGAKQTDKADPEPEQDAEKEAEEALKEAEDTDVKKEEPKKKEPKEEKEEKEEKPKKEEPKKEEPKKEEPKKEEPKKKTEKKVEVPQHGNPKCPCVGLAGFHGAVNAKVGEKETAEYPGDAFSTCQAWDNGRHPSCKEGEEPGEDNGWCATKWCYVDPCKCDIPVSPKASAYFPEATYQGQPLWYSYATCGGKDSYTSKPIKEPDFCDKKKDDAKFGKEDCRCIGYENIDGTIKVGETSFPADVGATCEAWDGKKSWCFVDPCTCPSAIAAEKSDRYGKITTQGHAAFISYETCGSEVITNEAAVTCVTADSKEKCLAGGCAWNGASCVTNEVMEVCGASKDFPYETFEEFLPSCVVSLKDTIQTVEHAYTHEQLVKALTDECAIDHKFPTVRDDFFDRRKECYNFAQQLEAARKAELRGDKKAYDRCCHVLWAEKGPSSPKVEEPAPAETVKSGSMGFAPVSIPLALAAFMLS